MNRRERRRAAAIKRKQIGYGHRVLAAFANGSVSLKPGGGLYHAIIQHDSWCAIYQGGGCNCTLDISVCGDDAVTIIDEEGIGTKVKRS
jgi:hypothetical protein